MDPDRESCDGEMSLPDFPEVSVDTAHAIVQQPLRSWGERPLGYLFEVMRFLLNPPSSGWTGLRP